MADQFSTACHRSAGDHQHGVAEVNQLTRSDVTGRARAERASPWLGVALARIRVALRVAVSLRRWPAAAECDRDSDSPRRRPRPIAVQCAAVNVGPAMPGARIPQSADSDAPSLGLHG